MDGWMDLSTWVLEDLLVIDFQPHPPPLSPFRVVRQAKHHI